MFGFLKRSKEQVTSQERKVEESNHAAQATAPAPQPVLAPTENRLDFSTPVTEEEKEAVSVITSAILAGDRPDSVFKVKSVTGIDTDKEAAAVIVSAVLAGDRPDSMFRLKSITEITQNA